jgi:hypothetical protein
MSNANDHPISNTEFGTMSICYIVSNHACGLSHPLQPLHSLMAALLYKPIAASDFALRIYVHNPRVHDAAIETSA